MTKDAPNRYFPLGMLTIVYTLNFIDRNILAILASPIKAELQLSDTQLGALGGLSFALLYSIMGLPLAYIADRTSRTWVITVCLGVWSAFTALCGLASSFWQLFCARLGVGVGEAGGSAPSYAVIADYFPQQERSFALAIYSLGAPIGSALGLFLGGYIAAAVDWRVAFYVAGVVGLIFAPVFRLCIKEPPRTIKVEGVRFSDVVAILSRKRSFWLLSFGAGFSSMLGYGLAFWMPSILQRSFKLDLLESSQFYGTAVLIGATCGTLLGGWFGDKLGSNRTAYAKLPAVAFLAAAPLFVLCVMSPTPTVAFLMMVVPLGLSYVWLGPVISAIQQLVPSPMRATASSCFLLINTLVGLGGGTLFLGALSDILTAEFGVEGLRYAIVFSQIFYVVAAVLIWLSAKHLAKEWVD